MNPLKKCGKSGQSSDSPSNESNGKESKNEDSAVKFPGFKSIVIENAGESAIEKQIKEINEESACLDEIGNIKDLR